MFKILNILCLLLLTASGYAADDAVLQADELDQELQQLKQDMLEVSTELSRIEQQLLFPADTHVNVFVSLTDKADILLEAANLEIDKQLVASHLYTEQELRALSKGGVQKLYSGNVITGVHELSLNIIGRTSAGDDFNYTQTYQLEKNDKADYVEAQISSPAAAENAADKDVTDKNMISFRDQ